VVRRKADSKGAEDEKAEGDEINGESDDEEELLKGKAEEMEG
jgi:hypothetical protein